jgi:hypothetical protein
MTRYILLVSLVLTAIVAGAQDQKEFEKDFKKMISDAENKHQIKERTVFVGSEEGISCRQVRVTDMRDVKVGNTLVYGQKIKIHFDHMKGFVPEKGFAYPSMSAYWKDDNGEVLTEFVEIGKSEKYHYNDQDGIKEFGAFFTIARPLFSGKNYTFSAKVSDTKGEGVFKFEFKMKLTPNPYIRIEPLGMNCSEAAIYHYDSDSKKYFYSKNNKLNSYAPNYLSISGLTGFSKNKEGNTELSIHVETIDRDSGEVVKSILDNPNYTIGSTDSSDVRVKLDYLPIVNSYNAIVRVIWRDKLSDKKLIVYFDK